jgi:hypothetical protein
VLDNDRTGKKEYKELVDVAHINQDQVQFISRKDSSCIEDMFTRGDFNKYILNGNNKDISMSNSKFVGAENIDKVLIAKHLFESISNNGSEIKFAQTTIQNFTNLFDQIEKYFK